MNVHMKLPNLLLAGLLPWIALSIRSLNPNSPSLNASQLEYRFIPAIVGADRGILEALAPISRKADVVVASLGYGLVTRPQHERWVYIFDVIVEANWRRRGIATEMIRRLLAYIKRAWPRVTGAYLGVLPLNGPAQRVYKRIGFVHRGEPARFREGVGGVFGVGTFEALAPISRKAEIMVASLKYGFVTRPQHERWVYIFAVRVEIKGGWPQVAGAYLGVFENNEPAKRLYEKIGFVHRGEAQAASIGSTELTVATVGFILIKKGWPQVAGAYLAVWPPNDPAKRAYEKIGFIYVDSVDMINNGE
ncbi:hypothetical protein FOZ60_014711 [Perkinsus olseni]|uniref:N-acetyltransferase domain-containing protein n=1 Tax=Perkinsus olseni TaxID=32597 RepID=A0A7J6P6T0_PEROL|nr:hypothetical protein FOZ60_014711 [Perkinsus olseni]